MELSLKYTFNVILHIVAFKFILYSYASLKFAVVYMTNILTFKCSKTKLPFARERIHT